MKIFLKTWQRQVLKKNNKFKKLLIQFFFFFLCDYKIESASQLSTKKQLENLIRGCVSIFKSSLDDSNRKTERTNYHQQNYEVWYQLSSVAITTTFSPAYKKIS